LIPVVVHGVMNVTKSANTQQHHHHRYHNNNNNNNISKGNTSREKSTRTFEDFFEAAAPSPIQLEETLSPLYDGEEEDGEGEEEDSHTDHGNVHEIDDTTFNLDWNLLNKKPSPGSLFPATTTTTTTRGRAAVSVQKELERFCERLAQHLEGAFLSEVERDAEMDNIFDNLLENNNGRLSNFNFNFSVHGQREERLGLVRLYASGSGAVKLRTKEKTEKTKMKSGSRGKS
jgi:hypothetical protein